MIDTEFQRLLRSIHTSLKDDHFIVSLRQIIKSGIVDIPSLIVKLEHIRNNLNTPENAIDIVVEIKAASQFCDLPNLNSIRFGENPDVKIMVSNETFSIEVKRFRFRPKDKSDSITLENYGVMAVTYGSPQEVQLQIEDVLLKKAESYTGKEPFYIYLWSDSPHQVENSEIKCAARAIKTKVCGILFGVFYKGARCSRNLISLESNTVTSKIEEFLKSTFSICK